MKPRLLSTIFSNPADLTALIWALTLVAVFLSLALVVKKEVGVVSAYDRSLQGKSGFFKFCRDLVHSGI